CTRTVSTRGCAHYSQSGLELLVNTPATAKIETEGGCRNGKCKVTGKGQSCWIGPPCDAKLPVDSGCAGWSIATVVAIPNRRCSRKCQRLRFLRHLVHRNRQRPHRHQYRGVSELLRWLPQPRSPVVREF